VFAPDKSLQPNLLLTGKALALPKKQWTRLERPDKVKHASLLRTFVNYGRKKFYYIFRENLFYFGVKWVSCLSFLKLTLMFACPLTRHVQFDTFLNETKWYRDLSWWVSLDQCWDFYSIMLDCSIYQFLPILAIFYQFLPIFTTFYQFLPIFTNFYQLLPIFSNFFQF